MDPVYKAPVLVLLRNSQECRLVLDGYACEAASEECDLYLLQPSSRKGGQVILYQFSDIIRRHIRLSGCDGFLVAEHTVIGTASVRDEYWYYGVFFHVSMIHVLYLLVKRKSGIMSKTIETSQ